MKKTFKKTLAGIMAMCSLVACMAGDISAIASSIADSTASTNGGIVGPPAIIVPNIVYNPAPMEQSYSKFYRSVHETNGAYTASDYIYIKEGKGTRYVEVNIYSYGPTGNLNDSNFWNGTLSQGNSNPSVTVNTAILCRVKFEARVYGSLKPYGEPTDSYNETKTVSANM